MRRTSIETTLLIIAVFFVLSSCSRSGSLSRKGNYPMVSKIKTERSFRKGFRADKTDRAIVLNETVKRVELTDRGDVKLESQEELRTIQNEKLKKENRKFRERKERIGIIEKYSRSDTKEALLATTDQSILTEPSIRLDKKAVQVLDDPERQRGTDPAGFAIASFILGFIGLFIFGIPFGILAIVFGAIALRRYRVFGGRLKGLAIAGVILGVLSIIGALLVISIII